MADGARSSQGLHGYLALRSIALIRKHEAPRFPDGKSLLERTRDEIKLLNLLSEWYQRFGNGLKDDLYNRTRKELGINE